MKPKTIIKIVIDVFMTIGLLFACGTVLLWDKHTKIRGKRH